MYKRKLRNLRKKIRRRKIRRRRRKRRRSSQVAVKIHLKNPHLQKNHLHMMKKRLEISYIKQITKVV